MPSSKKVVTKKQSEREAQISYDKLVSKWNEVPKFARTQPPKKITKLVLDFSTPPGRETPVIKSLVTSGSSTAKKLINSYTGSEIVGIAQMHKSNAVPVFNKSAALEVAKMKVN